VTNLDLTDEETAALVRELNAITDGDRYQFSAPHPDPEGDPGQAATAAGARTATAAEGVRAAAGARRPEAPRAKPETGPPMTLGGAAKAGVRIIV